MTAKLHPDIAKAIAPVKEGEITPVIKTKEGLVIYRVDRARTASVKAARGSEEGDSKRIWSQKFDPELKRFIVQLKEDAYIQIFTETK